MSKPLSRAIVAAFAVLLVLPSVSLTQVIQKWKTPSGRLYFGDRPPPGSTKIGQEGSNETSDSSPPPEEAQPRSPREDTLSVEASRERSAIEKALNEGAAHLADIRKQITETERLPDNFSGRVTNYATGNPTKPETLRALHVEERKTLDEMALQWKKFDKLNERVLSGHRGSPPDWWRNKITCAACPSRAEAESASQ